MLIDTHQNMVAQKCQTQNALHYVKETALAYLLSIVIMKTTNNSEDPTEK